MKPIWQLFLKILPLHNEVEEGGPQSGEEIIDLHKLFGLHWILEEEEMPPESIERRANREIFMRWKKK